MNLPTLSSTSPFDTRGTRVLSARRQIDREACRNELLKPPDFFLFLFFIFFFVYYMLKFDRIYLLSPPPFRFFFLFPAFISIFGNYYSYEMSFYIFEILQDLLKKRFLYTCVRNYEIISCFVFLFFTFLFFSFFSNGCG